MKHEDNNNDQKWCASYYFSSVLSARVPDCQKIKKSGLEQYSPEHFEV